jgi:hypothetical protein
LATALSLQQPSPFCHPERSRADLLFRGPFLEMFLTAMNALERR